MFLALLYASQSPFSSGEVFHSSILNNLAENTKPDEKMQ